MLNLRMVMKPYPMETTLISEQCIPSHLGYRSRMPQFLANVLSLDKKKPETPPGTMKKVMVQTLYRESEAQTDPYNTDYAEPEDKGLEVLTLAQLSWQHGLPAGMHEVEMIERARQMRAWKEAMPNPYDENTLALRKVMIRAMDLNEWSFRESELQVINEMRIEIAEKIMSLRLQDNRALIKDRMDRYAVFKFAERTAKLHKAKLEFNRNVRKLVAARDKLKKKYHKWNIIKEHMDKTSEFYGPQMRFGENPRRWHEDINSDCRYWNIFNSLEVITQDKDSVPLLESNHFNYENNSKPKKHAKELCLHETKWTEKYLEQLYLQLKAIRLKILQGPRPCGLKRRIPPPAPKPQIPSVDAVSDWDEQLYQASLLLQKTTKGRAIQAVMFEGRVRCQELIEELKSTHALQKHMEDTNARDRKLIYGLQRQAELKELHEKRKKEILLSLEGKTNADILDFLAKELVRLQNERTTHAFALLADRERHKREAAEAGTRQAEEQRRREHDEMFKQVMKVNQNTVDVYLQDVIMETKNWMSQREAREHIHNMAKKIDQAANEASIKASYIEEEEMIADLVHNFALPEAQKRIVRQRLKSRQKNYLQTCHDEVYANIDKLVQGPRTPRGKLLSLPRVTKHKVPPLIPVKILKLKRMRGSPSSDTVTIETLSARSSRESKATIKTTDTAQVSSRDKDKPIWSSGYSKQDIVISRTNSRSSELSDSSTRDDSIQN